MKSIFGGEFEARFEGKAIEGYELTNCSFLNCVLAPPATPGDRALIRNVTIRNAKHRSGSIFGAVLEDVHVSGLGRLGRSPFFLWAPAFRHVTLEGKLSSIMINKEFQVFDNLDQPAWDQANREFYASVDWALDISLAEFQGGFRVDAVPGHLVRRDEETQILVSRKNLSQTDWRSLDWDGSSFQISIDRFLKDGLYDETVLVAPKRAKHFQEDLRTLEILRREGLAV
jgi:hypothetical protein